jgi:CRP-like cAMP-binding protein
VTAIDERLYLLKLHPCARGLSEEALLEIAECAETVHCLSGAYVHKTGEPVTAIYLVIHGRLRISVSDIQGRKVMDRYQGAGGQFGGVAAALAEPSPVECVAQDPSTLLKIDYTKCLELTKKHDLFRVNFAKAMAESVKRAIFNDRLPARPRMVAFFHQDDQTRIVSQKLLQRLVLYGEQLGVLTDHAHERPIEGLNQRRVLGGERDWTIEEVRKQSAQWLGSGRVFADCSTTIDPTRAASILEKAELVLWCVTPQNWQASVQRLREIESCAPEWRDEVCILWLLEADESAPVAR